MNNVRRIVSFLLMVAVLSIYFIGCDDDSNTVSQSSSNINSIFSTEDVYYIDGNKESVYSVVRPENGDSIVSSYVYKQLKEKVGVSVKHA